MTSGDSSAKRITIEQNAPRHAEPDDPPDDGAPSGSAVESDSPAAALEHERDTLRDQLLRKAAEFDNYRKRVERERREFVDFAAQDLLLELLPIIDNFERALAAGVPPDADAYRGGVELIYKQLQELLRKRGVTTFQSVGADFDPNVHQAIAHELSEAHRDGEVMAELQRGYRLGERLLREAMVKVAKREQA
jgi:molecular chaperone GrpE